MQKSNSASKSIQRLKSTKQSTSPRNNDYQIERPTKKDHKVQTKGDAGANLHARRKANARVGAQHGRSYGEAYNVPPRQAVSADHQIRRRDVVNSQQLRQWCVEGEYAHSPKYLGGSYAAETAGKEKFVMGIPNPTVTKPPSRGYEQRQYDSYFEEVYEKPLLHDFRKASSVVPSSSESIASRVIQLPQLAQLEEYQRRQLEMVVEQITPRQLCRLKKIHSLEKLQLVGKFEKDRSNSLKRKR